MTFSQIQGYEDIKGVLAGMVDSGRVPHAIMFHEDDGGCALRLSLAFLQYLFCRNAAGGDSCAVCPSCNKISKLIHPDIRFVFPTNAPLVSSSYAAQWRSLVLSNPSFSRTELAEALGIEGKSSLIAVAEAREILSFLSLNSLEGGYRAVLVYLPEKMNQEAANRLLKIIEEPLAGTQFIFITHAPEKVLSTILSRCQLFRVKPSAPPRAASGESAALYADLFSQLMDALIARDLPLCLEIAESLAALPSRESAKDFCFYASEALRRIFLTQQGLSALCTDATDSRVCKCRKTFPRMACGAVDRARGLIERNVNLKILFTDMVDKLYTFI